MPLRRTHPRATAATPPTTKDDRREVSTGTLRRDADPTGPADEPAYRSQAGTVRASTLLLMTSLGAIDGTILLLAAQGVLDTVGGAVLTGLTVIGGAGAWITARQAFGHRHRIRDHLALAAIALVGSLATISAAALGAWLGDAIDFAVLPRAVGVILMLIAGEVGGLRLPHLAGMPMPLSAIIAAVLLEVLAQWTP